MLFNKTCATLLCRTWTELCQDIPSRRLPWLLSSVLAFSLPAALALSFHSFQEREPLRLPAAALFLCLLPAGGLLFQRLLNPFFSPALQLCCLMKVQGFSQKQIRRFLFGCAFRQARSGIFSGLALALAALGPLLPPHEILLPFLLAGGCSLLALCPGCFLWAGKASKASPLEEPKNP